MHHLWAHPFFGCAFLMRLPDSDAPLVANPFGATLRVGGYPSGAGLVVAAHFAFGDALLIRFAVIRAE